MIYIGVKQEYQELAHHNFFYSEDSKHHFATVFNQKELPQDPTLYVVAPTRTVPSQVLKGYDCINILPHIPYVTDEFKAEDYQALKERGYMKIERIGSTDLRKKYFCRRVNSF